MKSKYIIIAAAALATGALASWIFLLSPRHADLGNAALANTAEILKEGPRPPASDALQRVRKLVSGKLAAAGWIVTEQSFERFTPIGTVRFANVRARFPRQGESDPWSRPVDGILSAHIDSKPSKDNSFVGADDSASAVGAILEIARILATKSPDQARRLEIVFFDGEESLTDEMTTDDGPIPKDGLYGSRAYALLWKDAPALPRFGILLDMVGHKNLSIRLPGDTPADLKKACLAAAAAENAAARFAMSLRQEIGDDHVPLNRAGIPTIDIVGDYSTYPWWHTPADNLQNLSAESLDISSRVTLRLLDTLLAK